MSAPVRSIAFLKLCCVGDVIFMTPAIRAARERWPGARIFFIGSNWVREVAERIPWVDEFLQFDPPFRGTARWDRVRAGFALVTLLRRNRFDMILIGHRNKSFATAARAGGAAIRVGFSGAPSLTHGARFDESMHEVDRYLSLAAAAGAECRSVATEIAARPEDERFGAEFFARAGYPEGRRFIGIFPGGGKNPGTSMSIKRWYPERYAILAAEIHRAEGLVPVLLGGAQDRDAVDAVAAALPRGVPRVDASESGGFGNLCGVLKRCALVVGGDSGPVHLAAALKVPTVMIFGPSDPRLVAPRGERHRMVWTHPECSPCYTPDTVLNARLFEGNEFPCRTGTHICLKGLEADEVIAACREAIGGGAE